MAFGRKKLQPKLTKSPIEFPDGKIRIPKEDLICESSRPDLDKGGAYTIKTDCSVRDINGQVVEYDVCFCNGECSCGGGTPGLYIVSYDCVSTFTNYNHCAQNVMGGGDQGEFTLLSQCLDSGCEDYCAAGVFDECGVCGGNGSTCADIGWVCSGQGCGNDWAPTQYCCSGSPGSGGNCGPPGLGFDTATACCTYQGYGGTAVFVGEIPNSAYDAYNCV